MVSSNGRPSLPDLQHLGTHVTKPMKKRQASRMTRGSQLPEPFTQGYQGSKPGLGRAIWRHYMGMVHPSLGTMLAPIAARHMQKRSALSSTTANSDSEDDYGPPVHVNVVTIERIREVLLGDTEESNPADQEAAEEVQHHSISEDDEVDDNNVHETASGIGDMVRWLMMKMCYLPPLQEG